MHSAGCQLLAGYFWRIVCPYRRASCCDDLLSPYIFSLTERWPCLGYVVTSYLHLFVMQAIIGTIGDIDSYQLPDSKGYTAFMRHVLNVTDEERQQRREEILGTTVKDFR